MRGHSARRRVCQQAPSKKQVASSYTIEKAEVTIATRQKER
jgi:hypothetical protein